MSGGKVLTPPALVCGSVAVLSGLIGTLLTEVVRGDGHHTAGQLLVVRAPSLLTPCSSEMQLCAVAYIDAGSVTRRFGQKPMFPRVSGGLHLGKR